MSYNKYRYAVQAFFIGLLAFIGYRHQVVGGGPTGSAPIHAYCPFGALEALPAYLASGTMIAKTAFSNFWLFGIVLLITILFGSIFCGWMCPLGGVAEWLYALRSKIYKGRINIPPQIAKVLGFGRYIMLVLIVYMSYTLGTLWFAAYDPFTHLFHMNVETTTGWVILIAFIAASLLIERVWCRFFCPLGGLLGLLGKFSIFKIKRNQDTCINCSKCSRVCPMQIEVAKKDTVNDADCIKCYECIDDCPKKGALAIVPSISAFGKSVKPLTVGIMSIVILTGAFGMVYVSGQWNPKNPNIKAAVQIMDVSEIKGWMKWNDVIKTLKVDEAKIIKELKLPNDFDRNKTIKALEKEYHFSEETLRELIKKQRSR